MVLVVCDFHGCYDGGVRDLCCTRLPSAVLVCCWCGLDFGDVRGRDGDRSVGGVGVWCGV